MRHVCCEISRVIVIYCCVIVVRSLRVRFHFLDRNRLQCSVFTLSLPLEASAIFLLQLSTVYVQPFNSCNCSSNKAFLTSINSIWIVFLNRFLFYFVNIFSY